MSPKSDQLFRKGLTLLQAGQLPEAAQAFRKALRDDRTHIGALNLLGIVLTQLNQFAEAETHLAAALRQNPNTDATLYNYGVVLQALKRPAEALQRFDAALAINSSIADTWNNRGAALNQLERYEDAVASFDKAIALQPTYAQAYANKARALSELKRYDEALKACEQALAYDPQLVEAWFGHGNVLLKFLRHEDALRSFERANAIDPQFGAARLERGTTLLALGRFQEGWQAYDWRTQVSDFVPGHPAIEARIRTPKSHEDFAGKTVAVIAEQGVGDEIMFGTMLPDLLRDAKAVTYQLDSRLIGIFSQSFPSVKFVAKTSHEDILAEPFDLTVRAGSLGLAYRPDLKSFPRTPYLKPQPEHVQRWRSALDIQDNLLQVGIAWRGGTKNTGNNDRSMTLEQMKPLLARADCRFVSLQYGNVTEEIESFNRAAGGKIRHFPKEQIDDFEDLGALIEALDLVVSVQNTNVHLCGAIGKTCFAMLPRQAEWRYGASGKEMAWYSSVELYRQATHGDWAGLLDAINRRIDADIGRWRARRG
jgi:tetratricopeptide (TPR) repeat protein